MAFNCDLSAINWSMGYKSIAGELIATGGVDYERLRREGQFREVEIHRGYVDRIAIVTRSEFEELICSEEMRNWFDKKVPQACLFLVQLAQFESGLE